MTDKAAILARGLGTRMRKDDGGTALDAEQAAVAETGVKGMIPIGRPFMDYLVSALADAGFTDVCLVIGPEHRKVSDYYEKEITVSRVRIHIAIQERPLGTADAVLAAEGFAGGESFAVVNSDNYYPIEALAALHARRGPALIAFERAALVRLGNVQADRAQRFGALDIGPDGFLRRVVAGGEPRPNTGDENEIYSSLNCWLFTPEIFRACRDVPLSARGESELPQAVQLAIDEMGIRFEAVRMSTAVLDMSSRADIAAVAERLQEVQVRL